MPTRAETYRQTWVDPKYELFQANIQQAMAEDVRLREDLALQRQFIEKRILQAEKAVDALEKQQIKSFADAGSAIGPKNSDVRGFHALYQSAHKKFLDQYDTPSGLEGAVASLIATAISPEVTAIVDPADQAAQILAMLRTDDLYEKMVVASSKQREAMANELAAMLKESVEGISDFTAIDIAAAAMSTPGKEINPVNVDVSGFTDRINMESRREAVREINPARREAGMPLIDEKTLERLDPATGKPEDGSLKERSSAANKEITSAKTDLEKLILERTRLTKEAEAPSESDLRQRAIEMNIDIFRKRKDRKPPKDPAELMQFLGRDAIQYIKDQDPTTDGSKAGTLATQINGLLAAGTMRRGQLLEIAGNYAGKDKDLRNEIITRVLAHALKEMASTSADPEAALKTPDEPIEVATEAMKEQAQQRLQAIEQDVDAARVRLKDAASTPPMPVQSSKAGGAFSGPDQVIASLPLNAQQQEMAQLIYDKFTAAGIPEAAAYAAIVNAAAESSLDPSAQFQEASGSMAVGLFQLNDAPGAMGEGLSLQDRLDPSFNIDRMIEAIQGPQGERFLVGAQSGVQSIDELTAIFTEDLERPANRTQKGAERAATASEWFGRGVISPTLPGTVFEPTDTLSQAGPAEPPIPPAEMPSPTTSIGFSNEERERLVARSAESKRRLARTESRIDDLKRRMRVDPGLREHGDGPMGQVIDPLKAELKDAQLNLRHRQAEIDAIESRFASEGGDILAAPPLPPLEGDELFASRTGI